VRKPAPDAHKSDGMTFAPGAQLEALTVRTSRSWQVRISRPVGTLALAIHLGACGGTAPPPSSPQVSATASAEPVPAASSTEASAPPPPAAPGPTSASGSASTKPEPRAQASGSPMAQLMREHFKEAEQIRHAVISGKQSDAVQPALALGSSVDIATLPEPWRPSVQLMFSASNRVQNSSDLAEAAAGTADIGLACGNCHASQGGPKAHLGEPPAAGDSVVGRMARHSWAMERLWEGLYLPSSVAWKAGARALQEDPFPAEVLERGGVYGRSAAKDFKQLAAQAGSKETPKDRGALYAGLLGTCATCHIATGRGKN